jgi:hypothetical protein
VPVIVILVGSGSVVRDADRGRLGPRRSRLEDDRNGATRPASDAPPQVEPETANSVGFVPAMEIEAMLSVPFPILISTAVLGAPTVPCV